MVYFLGDWGMGDSECSTCQNVPDLLLQQTANLQSTFSHLNNSHHHLHGSNQSVAQSAHDLLSPLNNDTESDEDEISLFPLSNQVRGFFFCFGFSRLKIKFLIKNLSQVGGHTRLLLLNQSTVIKPLNIRELDFYQNIPQDVKAFVPKYRGKWSAAIYFVLLTSHTQDVKIMFVYERKTMKKKKK